VDQKKKRFVVVKSGRPTAVLIGVTDLDDMLEELDPEFQKSLKFAVHEYRTSKTISLLEYLKEQLSTRQAG